MKTKHGMRRRVLWQPASTPPDSDTTVLIAMDDSSEPVFLGYWCSGDHEWRDIHGAAVKVTHWALLPVSPAEFETASAGRIPLKAWIHIEAARTGKPARTVSTYVAKGKIPLPKGTVRINRRVILVPANSKDGAECGELAKAAASYLATHAEPDEYAEANGLKPAPAHDWPWAKKWWKPSDDPVRNLVKAGALIAAEIDRLQRKAAR